MDDPCTLLGTVPGGQGALTQHRSLHCWGLSAFLKVAAGLGRAVDVLTETASGRAGTLSTAASTDILGRCVLHC